MTTSEHAASRWAQHYGALPDFGEAFARWYVSNDRTDSYAVAYDVFRELFNRPPVADVETSITEHTARAHAVRGMSAPELSKFYGWSVSDDD